MTGSSKSLTYNYTPINVAIFASGAGTNSQNIIDYFKNNSSIKIALIVCNRQGAGVLQIAEKENIPVLLIEREKFLNGDAYLDFLKIARIHFIVLAGFLWKIPTSIINEYPGKIINIHPALLPKHGGKKMYGHFVHESVLKEGDKESGITIHYIDDQYDNGKIIFQQKCNVDVNDTPETLADKIHALEYENYPPVIKNVIATQFGN